MNKLRAKNLFRESNIILIPLLEKKYMLYHISSGMFYMLNDNDVTINQGKIKILRNEIVISLDKQSSMHIDECKITNRLKSLQYMSSECCNMKCKYCYANEGTYNNKTDAKMFTLEKYIKTYESISKRYSEGIENITFFGGEPLLNYQEIKKFVEYNKGIGIAPKYSIITNGTIFNEEIFKMLKVYSFNVTVSIDGPQKINDFNRIDIKGNGTFERVNKFLVALNECGIKPAIEMTITKYHVLKYRKGKLREWIQFLEKYDLNGYAPFIVVDNTIRYNNEEIEQIKSIFSEFVDIFFEDLRYDKKSVNLKILKMTYSVINRKYQKDCGAGRSITVGNDLFIYPCQMFVNDTKYRLNLDNFSPIKGNSTLFHEMNSYRTNVSRCKKCNVRNFCGVWCRGLNYLNNSKTDEPIDIRCTVENVMFEEIIKNLASLELDEINEFKKNISRIVTSQMR